MLIEFSVSNYKSFRDRQTLSMVAAPRLGKKKNVVKPEVEGGNIPALLRVAAIYGPNASGKSSLIKAIDFVSRLIHHQDLNDPIPAKPFRFDSNLRREPSLFEYNFVTEGMRYEYLVGATEERITHESLTCYPKGKPIFLFSRDYSNGREVYDLSNDLEGNDIVHEAWMDLTSPKDLFLSKAAQHSSENLNQLKPAHNWFKTSTLCIEHDGMGSWSSFSRSFLQRNPEMNEHLEKFISEFDIPVSKISFEDLAGTAKPSKTSTQKNKWLSAEADFKTKLTHTTALGSAEFEFEEESGGTQNLMGFWLPWHLFSQTNPGCVVVDELDSSLHPKIVEMLINKHLAGVGNGQIIFTTHDTHLMNTKVLRRDQFWITERDSFGATQLFSVHDFEGRDSEDVEKRYYEGRYRGLPILTGE